MKSLYRFELDTRNGSLDSVFVATEEEIERLKKRGTMTFEVAKHTDIDVDFSQDKDYRLRKLTDDQCIVQFFEANKLSIGDDPVEQMKFYEQEECEDQCSTVGAW